MVSTYNFPMFRGDSRVLGFTVKNNDTGLPLDLTGATPIKFTGKLSREQVSSTFQKLLSSGITLVDADAGKLQVILAPGDTSELDISEDVNYIKIYYDLEITLASGQVYTVLQGVITLVKDITTS